MTKIGPDKRILDLFLEDVALDDVGMSPSVSMCSDFASCGDRLLVVRVDSRSLREQLGVSAALKRRRKVDGHFAPGEFIRLASRLNRIADAALRSDPSSSR